LDEGLGLTTIVGTFFWFNFLDLGDVVVSQQKQQVKPWWTHPGDTSLVIFSGQLMN
jgi:hypothetical protein